MELWFFPKCKGRQKAALFWVWMVFLGVAPLSKGVTHDVLPGTSIKKLARELKEEKLIPYAFWLEWRLRWQGKPILAGEYEVSPELSTSQLIRMFTEGLVKQYKISIIDGWRVGQLLEQLPHLAPNLEQTITSPQALAQALSCVSSPFTPLEQAEGWLFPETYYYTKGMRDRDLYGRAYHYMVSQLLDIWAHRDAKSMVLRTPYELLILASIIEKETALPDEMPKISGVFHRRLQKKMRLQADATVIYGLGASYTGVLKKKDLLKDTPYNSYTRSGLPPTPIAIPSRVALVAAAHPEDGEDYYFVALGDGTHVFSKTLEAHQMAVRQYIQWKKRGALDESTIHHF